MRTHLQCRKDAVSGYGPPWPGPWRGRYFIVFQFGEAELGLRPLTLAGVGLAPVYSGTEPGSARRALGLAPSLSRAVFRQLSASCPLPAPARSTGTCPARASARG